MSRTPDWEYLSKTVPLLAALPAGMRSRVALREFAQGAFIFRQEDRPSAMFVIVSGEARLIRTTAFGGQLVLQRTRRGLFAEASLDQTRYHCDALAVLPTTLAVVALSAFKVALADESFRRAWQAELLLELRRVRAQAERLSLKSARARILHYIEFEGRKRSIELMQTRKDWAAELGLTHEALYRSLQRMVRDHELRIDGTRISIVT